MNAYAAFKIAFISLPIERMKQYISARFTLKYSEAFAVKNNPVRLLIRNAKKQLSSSRACQGTPIFSSILFTECNFKSKTKTLCKQKTRSCRCRAFFGALGW